MTIDNLETTYNKLVKTVQENVIKSLYDYIILKLNTADFKIYEDNDLAERSDNSKIKKELSQFIGIKHIKQLYFSDASNSANIEFEKPTIEELNKSISPDSINNDEYKSIITDHKNKVINKINLILDELDGLDLYNSIVNTSLNYQSNILCPSKFNPKGPH